MRCRQKLGDGAGRVDGRPRQNVDVPITVPGSEDHAPRHAGTHTIVDGRASVPRDRGIEGGRHQAEQFTVEGIEGRQLHGELHYDALDPGRT